MDHTDHNADDTTNMTSHQVSTTEPVIASSSSEKTTINLRELEISDRFFWKDSLIEQLSQNIEDKGTDGNPRKLLGNEITVMAFNEIALRRGRGFLFHLKERGCWQSHSKEELYPSSRDQPRPGSLSFPARYQRMN